MGGRLLKEPKNSTTLHLLESVSLKLFCIQGRPGRIMSDSENLNFISRCKKVADELEKTFQEPPNEITRLLIIVDWIIVDTYRCISSEDINLLPHQYTEEVREYELMGKKLNISIVNEINVDSSSQYCYVIFSFPYKPSLYHGERFVKSKIPELQGNEENDQLRLRSIFIAINRIYETVLSPYVSDGKFKSHDFNTSGIEPKLPRQLATKRRKRNEEEDTPPSQMTEPQPQREPQREPSALYSLLKKWFLVSKDRINAASILMTSISRILTKWFVCSSHKIENGWPYLDYKNETTVFLIVNESPLKTEGVTDSNIKKRIHVATLQNSKEFYVSIRLFDNEEEYCLKRIVKSLVLTFEEEDEDIDEQRLIALASWVTALFVKYIDIKLFGKKPSRSPSIVLTVSQSDRSSTSASTSAERTPSASASRAATPLEVQVPPDEPEASSEQVEQASCQ